MMKKLFITYLFAFGILNCYCQDVYIKHFEDNIVDRIREKQRDSLFNDFLDSLPDIQVKKGQFMPFNIYEFGTQWGSVIGMNENIIDTVKISKEYYLSGLFVKDFLDAIQSNDSTLACIKFGKIYAYDTLEHRAYRFSGWHSRFEKDNKGEGVVREISECLSYRSSSSFEDYIGYLLHKELVDVVFYFPTFMDYEEGIISTLIEDICFAIKGEKLFVISQNWIQENGEKRPVLSSIEDYLDCCWKEMTGIKE